VEPPHGLLPVGAFVDHKAVSFLAQALLARYLSRDIHEVADQCLLLLLHVTDAWVQSRHVREPSSSSSSSSSSRRRMGEAGAPTAKGSLWDDEYVSRGLGRDVVEGDGSVILENLLGRNAAVDDLGKDGVFGIDLQLRAHVRTHESLLLLLERVAPPPQGSGEVYCGRCGPRLVTHAAPLWVARTRGKEEGSGLGQ